LLLDRDGTVLDCNKVYPTLFCITRDELIGHCIWDFFSEEDARWRREEVEQVFVSGESIHGQTQKDGKWSDYVEYPVFNNNGTVQSVTIYAMDITELKRAEAAVKETNKKLLLLSSITRHDILNNVAALQIYESLIEDAIEVHNIEEVKEDLNVVEEITDRIEEQITFTRDYEALGIQDPIWQNIGAVVEKAAGHVMVEHLNIDRKCSEFNVFADPMFGRVFFNLFDNALRHGGDVTEIRVRCTREEENIVIMVEDNGNGVADEMKATIFNRGVGSNTGYGLFLAKEILEISGIGIFETGVPGEGAHFKLIVPPGTWSIAK
jgi:PAS domain S-box-containing protein